MFVSFYIFSKISKKDYKPAKEYLTSSTLLNKGKLHKQLFKVGDLRRFDLQDI